MTNRIETMGHNINTYMVVNAPKEKVIHALSESMPMCDLASGVDAVDTIQRGDVCNVYCAQQTCDAAVNFIKDHIDDFEKCQRIHYWKQGSIEIDEALLKDGSACKTAIRAWNFAHA